jgi:excisionase family DNA binding protein
MLQEWLSLSKVAQVLGVHPSTVRNWSDQGMLPVHRTQGGHRRYLRSEIDLWVEAQRSVTPDDAHLVIKNMLRSTRLQVSEGHLQAESWYQKLDDDAKAQYRESGRALLHGMIGFLNPDETSATAEADALGYEYAARGRRCGLNASEATHAFLFFRNLLLESMYSVLEAAAVNSPYAWSNMFRRMTAFTDQILVALLETYEVYQMSER